MKKIFFGLFLAVASVALVQVGCDPKATPAGASAPVVPSTTISTSPIASGFSNPYGLTADSAGNVYVSEYTIGTITKVTPAGVKTTLASGFHHVRQLGIDNLGNILVADCYHHAIKKVSPTGVVTTLVQDPFVFFRPRGVATGNGNIYVTGGYRYATVWNLQNGHLTPLASSFGTASRVAADPNNPSIVYVADNSNNTVSRVVSGVVTPIANSIGKTKGIAVDNHGDVIFATDDNNIYMVTPGGVQSTLTSFSNPTGLFINPKNPNTIYVSNGSAVSKITVTSWP